MPPTASEPRLTPQQLHAVLEGVSDALVVIETSGAVAYLNSAATRFLAVAEPDGTRTRTGSFDLRDHVQGRFEMRRLDGVLVAEASQPLVRALRGEVFRDVELLVKRKGEDGAKVLVFSVKRIESTTPLGVLTIRDDTDRWRAERRYRVAFEADPAPSVIARLEDARILEANEGMADLTGVANETLRKRSLVDLETLQQTDDLKDAFERLRAGQRVHKVKRQLKNVEGEELSVLLSARAIEVEGQACGIFTFIDISDLETALRERREMGKLLGATVREHAVERAEMTYVATTDALTGIANRRGLNARLSEEFARAERYDGTFSLLLVDVDHFKAVNDSYGHDAGDTALREIAQLLQQECREPDLAGRWGGEEFMIILEQADLAAATEVAARVLERVEGHRFADIGRLTLSIGVTSLAAGDTTDSLFARADRALYLAKERGRNRIEAASSDSANAGVQGG